MSWLRTPKLPTPKYTTEYLDQKIIERRSALRFDQNSKEI